MSLFKRRLPKQQAVSERGRGEGLDEGTQAEVDAGHRKEPQAADLVVVLLRAEFNH